MVEAELDALDGQRISTVPKATPNKFNKFTHIQPTVINKVREIDLEMTSSRSEPFIFCSEYCIGGGMFGDCYKHYLQGFPVCIKVFKDSSENGKILLQNEAAILSSLCHPSICWLWGMQSKVAPFYLVLTMYTVGGVSLSLHNLLRTYPKEDATDLSKIAVVYRKKLSCDCVKPVPQCSHTHSPYCLILQPNLPQCLSCCLTCFGWS